MIPGISVFSHVPETLFEKYFFIRNKGSITHDSTGMYCGAKASFNFCLKLYGFPIHKGFLYMENTATVVKSVQWCL